MTAHDHDPGVELPELPRVRPNIDLIEIGEQGIAYQADVNELHFLSPPARVLFELCDGTATLEQTAAEVAEAYGEPLDLVRADVRQTVADFARLGLLEGVQSDLERYSTELPADLADERERIRVQVPRST